MYVGSFSAAHRHPIFIGFLQACSICFAEATQREFEGDAVLEPRKWQKVCGYPFTPIFVSSCSRTELLHTRFGVCWLASCSSAIVDQT
ncbi:hypothetical protein GGS26DRAFT_568426 [Hypomontagnella submonticulosa]|nr:hypothetical protein GGS26DRAFT_568426 [Hypomontagnella submonticulosa]